MNILAQLWRALPDERQKLGPYVEKARPYRNECGCSIGGGFLIGSLVLLILYRLFFNAVGSGHWFTTTLRGTALVIGAYILGKLRFAHQFRPGTKIELTKRAEAPLRGWKHLQPTADGRVCLIAEDLYQDFGEACKCVVADIDTGKLSHPKLRTTYLTT